MKRLIVLLYNLLIYTFVFAQSISFKTYVNPIIPGDHPDPTLTKIGKYFYTSGSSFNPTPKIYRSTDLVHWKVIAQPVSAAWSAYGDNPGGGIWGGHTVFYNDTYWHFFGRGGGSMYFVTAEQPEGPWSTPTRMQVPSGMSGLGVDNSIFIDDETVKWYLLTKNGRQNNHILELGNDGQPNGYVLDLTWLNPDSDGNPYSWAEGPVMWKYNGYYYYSFAQHLAGAQYVMRSDTLTDEKSAWTIIGDDIFAGSRGTYNRPNHISPVVMLDDSTSWVVAHSYHSSSNWYAHGRQGLLCRVTYNEQDFPVIQFPQKDAVDAPALPSSGVPWMVPKSDMFDASTMKPEWSYLGYTPGNTHSLTEREGWLYLAPYRGSNTVIQNDGEHNYSLITRVDFEPETTSDEAGLWIMNGPETHSTKIYSSVNNEGKKIIAFIFDRSPFEVENKIGNTLWLKLVRDEHLISGFYSPEGINWTQIGPEVNAIDLDIEQTQFNNFTGNQQGLYVEGKAAYFDLYIYRDAYTDITAQNPVNHSGVIISSSYLRGINNDDWALYAGVEFGGGDYPIYPLSMELEAASNTDGGTVEVWLDSIDTGQKIAECQVQNTGGSTAYQIFTADVDSVSGSHDVYLKFVGTGTDELFRLKRFKFVGQFNPATSVKESLGRNIIRSFSLHQNYPNPFNPSTEISYSIPNNGFVELDVYNILGEKVQTLKNDYQKAGTHKIQFNGENISSGIYFYVLKVGSFTQVKKMLLVR